MLVERRRDVLAVIDATGKPLGAISETDVLRSLACALAGA
jgi:predicted transcriptional regulator